MTKTLFITATGTDIGKTYFTRLLIRKLKAQGHTVQAIKPVISGVDPEDISSSDSGLILKELGLDINKENMAQISPWQFQAPLSPDVAALAEGKKVPFGDLIEFCQIEQNQGVDYLIIEGVGGVMVPLDDHNSCLDWMAALDAEITLVAGTYLGCISHILTACTSLAHKNLSPKKIILSQSENNPVEHDILLSSLENFLPRSKIKFLERADLSQKSPPLSQLI